MVTAPWSQAWAQALYGPAGFYRRGRGPATDFRTSSTVAPGVLASAVAALLDRLPVDCRSAVVEVGAGNGSLLAALAPLVDPAVSLVGVDVRPRPPDLPARVAWRSDVPRRVVGLVLAVEWLDTVPLDVVEAGRVVVVDRDGREAPGPPVAAADAAWLRRWWPAGARREVGRPRDAAWADLVAGVERGVAVAVDYGHVVATRPPDGTLRGFRGGRVVRPVPDGCCDVTASVALDACAAGAGVPTLLLDQRTALRDLGVRGEAPAGGDAGAGAGAGGAGGAGAGAGGAGGAGGLGGVRGAGGAGGAGAGADYLAAHAHAAAARALLDPGGLGGFGWLVSAVGVHMPLASPCASPSPAEALGAGAVSSPGISRPGHA